MSDIDRLRYLAGLTTLNESKKEEPKKSGKKSFKDYLNEMDSPDDMETLGTDRNSAIKNIQARLSKPGQPGNPSTAAQIVDKLTATGGIKKDGQAMKMKPMSDKDFQQATGQVPGTMSEDADFKTHPERAGMFDGKTKAELRKMKTTVKDQMKAREEAGKPVTKALKTKLAQLNFALRAKNDWGKAE